MRKKLLHIQLLPLLSGVQNFSLHLLEGLDPNEYEIHIACKPGGEFVDAILERGYHYHPLSMLTHPISLKDLPAFWQIFRMIRRNKFDIVHTHSSKPGLLGRIAATLAGVPLILHTVHGTAFRREQRFVSYAAFAALEWLANRFCHKVVFVNNSDRINCVSMGLIPAAKAHSIYNALPLPFARKLEDVAAGRTAPSPEQVVIGSSLRFSTQKNVINLVTALCMACQQAPRLKFVLVGDGEHYGLCRQIVRTHNLNDRILLPGWDPDITPWLRAFDAFILYSRWEAQPFSIIEAMHSGLAVIGSDIPSIRELVDESCGYIATLDDEADLIQTLTHIAKHPQELRQKGEAAMQRVNELCEYRHMVDSYLEIYRGQA